MIPTARSRKCKSKCSLLVTANCFATTGIQKTGKLLQLLMRKK